MSSTRIGVIGFLVGATIGSAVTAALLSPGGPGDARAPERRPSHDIETPASAPTPEASSPGTSADDRPAEELRRLRARVAELEAAASDPARADDESEAAAREAKWRPPEALDELLAAGMSARSKGQFFRARQLWNELAQRLANDPDSALPGVLEWLGSPMDLNRLVAVRDLLSRRDLELDDETVAALREGLVDGLLAADDPEVQSVALGALHGLLRRQKSEGERIPAGQRADLVDLLVRSDDRKLRQQALTLLGEHARGSVEVVNSFDRIARSDSDPVIRARALAQLRGQDEQTAQALVLDVLESEIEPVVLWEAAKPANFLTLSSGSIRELKGSYQQLLHREVDDRARAQAAQSLALLATLDGDSEVPAELRYLASSTSDPALAEFARTAAAQLADGSATIVTIAEAWRPWHEQQDRERFP